MRNAVLFTAVTILFLSLGAFAQNDEYSLILTIEVEGHGTTDPAPGVHGYGMLPREGITVTAIPDEGHELDHWELNGTVQPSTDPLVFAGRPVRTRNFIRAVFVEAGTARRDPEPDEREVTIMVTGQGTTVPGPGVHYLPRLEGVSVTAVPDEGYELDHWEVDGEILPPEEILSLESAKRSRQPVADYVTIKARFVAIGTEVPEEGEVAVTVEVEGAGTVDPGPGSYVCPLYSRFVMEAVADEGYELDHWIINSESVDIQQISGLFFIADYSAPLTIRAVFEEVIAPPDMITVVVKTCGLGTTDPAPGEHQCINEYAEIFEITAMPQEGYELHHWMAEDFYFDGHFETLPLKIGQFAAPPWDPIVVTAFFVETGQQGNIAVAIQADGPGAVNPAGVYMRNTGDTVSVTATPNEGCELDHWEVNGEPQGGSLSLDITVPSRSQCPHGVLDVVAFFVDNGGPGEQAEVSIQTNGAGTTNPVPGVYDYDIGATASVTAIPDEGHLLDHWEVNGQPASNSPTLNVPITGPVNIVAFFVEEVGPVEQVEVSIQTNGAGTTNPVPGVYDYDVGATVSVTAIPDEGHLLDHWEVNGQPAGDSLTLDAPVTGPLNIVAFFVAEGGGPGELVEVSIETDGPGTTDPEPGVYDFETGDTVSVTAIPDEGFELDRWEVNGLSAGSDATLFVPVDGPLTIVAVFVEQGGGPGPGECTLESVVSLTPVDDAFISVLTGSEALGIVLAATTNCLEDTSEVYFELDEEVLDTLFEPNLDGIFQIFTPPVSQIGYGDHFLRDVASNEISVETSAGFLLLEQPSEADSDSNGLPDEPCDVLELPGDYWYSVVNIAATGLDRLSTATLFYGEEDTVLGIHEPDNPGMYVAVVIPGTLLNPGEAGIAVLQKAMDLDTLYGPEEAAVLAPLPGDLIPDSEVFEICILVGTDECESLEPIDQSRLLDHPIRIVMAGFTLPPDPFLYLHPTSCMIDEETGIQIFGAEGDWSTDAVTELILTENRMDAVVTAISAFALVEPTIEPGDPIIDVSPFGTVDFGCVNPGDNADIVFTVTNIGDGVLEGQAVTAEPFSIVGEAFYSLGADESAEITVRFSPTLRRNYIGEVTFCGQQTVILLGTARGNIFGCPCPANGAKSTDSKGDLAMLGLVGLGLLIPATRKRFTR